MLTNQMDNRQILNFYKRQIENDFLLFWEKAVDEKNGGIFTCFNNQGTELVSKNKYTWSQGRFIWLWSRLIQMIEKGEISGDQEQLKRQALNACNFLKKNVFLDNGNCAYMLDEVGNKMRSKEGVYDSSIYADCFVVIGFAEYAKAASDENFLQLAFNTYYNIITRVQLGNFRTDPYPIPQNYKAHSILMIILNVTAELLTAARQFRHTKSKEFEMRIQNLINDILNKFCRSDFTICEMMPSQPNNELLARHVNPGHTLECMWFVIDAAKKINILDKVVDKVAKIAMKTLELGWDQEFGGLLRFVDYKGGRPTGDKKGYAYEQLIIDTWDTKLWWPHSEALYSTLLLYYLTDDKVFLDWYRKFHSYVFSTFPNKDRQVGEWIQIRDRQGKPIDKVVALPVKDPFHILRNFILIVELLYPMVEEK